MGGGTYFSLLLMKSSVYDVLVLAKFQLFSDKIQSVQLLSSSFFSFSEEEKRSKKEELSFLTPEISNSAEFDLGRCPKNL